MKRQLAVVLVTVAAGLVGYLLAWPVNVEPVAWHAPEHRGYVGAHAHNTALAGVQRIELGAHAGPEDVVTDRDGRLYTGTEDGNILRIDADGAVTLFANVGGRPLGLEFAHDGALLVANAYLGLQRVATDGRISLLTDRVDGTPIGYADDLDIAPDGRVFFSDASTKFTPANSGGTYAASLPDILEHGGHGRLLVFDPDTGSTSVVLDGLQFANGVALDPLGQFVLVNETGAYRVLRYWLNGPNAGHSEVLVDNLPGFPDNLNRGLAGRYWIGLVAPRNRLLDALAPHPLLRKVVQRLPAWLRPAAARYTHALAVDANGRIVFDLQHDGSLLPAVTGVLETHDALYLSSLFGDAIGQIAHPNPPPRVHDRQTLVSEAGATAGLPTPRLPSASTDVTGSASVRLE